ncbi:hypothetical protein KKH46_02030 [Patescibacteria group bacterium]|nr:hypothetical protein [Patescibacteria group bacterium]
MKTVLGKQTPSRRGVKEKVKVKFAFVTNIIQTEDVRLKDFHPIIGRILPLWLWDQIFIWLAKKGWGFWCVAKYHVLDKAEGYTIIVRLTAKQVVSRKHLRLAKETILKACLYAQNELGVEIIGLGSLAKFITNEGEYLKKHGVHIAVTHGDAYAVASGIAGIQTMEKQFQLQNPVIAVIGAYGKIGRAMTLLLTKQGYKVIAMGRSVKRLKAVQVESGNKITITTDMKEALGNSQLAIATTSSPESIITEEMIELGRAYYLYDLGQPYNLFPEQYWNLIKQGYNIVRVDGGFEKKNGHSIDIQCWMRLNPGIMYACFVETVLQALAQDFDNYVGPVDLDHVQITKQRAKKWGFSHDALTCFNVPLKEVVSQASVLQKVAQQQAVKVDWQPSLGGLSRVTTML